MHSDAKGNRPFHWCTEGFTDAIRSLFGVDDSSELGHSAASTAPNLHKLNTAADRLHGEERVIYDTSGHIGIEQREAL